MPRAPSLKTEHPPGLVPGPALPAVCTGAGTCPSTQGRSPISHSHLSRQEVIRSSLQGMFTGWGRQDAKGTVPGECMREDTTQEERGGGVGGENTDALSSSPSPGLAMGAVRCSAGGGGSWGREGSCQAPGIRQAFWRLAWGQPAECGWQRCQCMRSKTHVAGGTGLVHSSSGPTSGIPTHQPQGPALHRGWAARPTQAGGQPDVCFPSTMPEPTSKSANCNLKTVHF